MTIKRNLAFLSMFAVVGCTHESAEHAETEHSLATSTSTASTEAASAKPKTKWSYAGSDGPENWGALAPDYSLCATGKEQSPIALAAGEATAGAPWSPLSFSYPASPARLVPDGHGFTIVPAAKSAMTAPKGDYELLQYHFHTPSEHTVDGKHFDAELHFVHKNAHGELAVVGLLFTAGPADNPALRPILDHAPSATGTEAASGGPVDVSALLPSREPYFTYPGSLTVPPCTEGITWFVFTTPRTIGTAQVEKLRTSFGSDTDRPVQPRRGRALVRFAP